MGNIGAVKKGKINKARYAEYVAELELTGQKFPINNFGQVNLSEIASKCGFNRQVFATNKSMKLQLEADVKRLGTNTTDSKQSSQKKEADKDVSRLIKSIDLKDFEILSLKKQIDELLKIVQELETSRSEHNAIYEELLLSGRRFTL